ncbi:MAG: SDR family NAD(P)-dependent oxidoreductase [bacterium]|nr:SDR family NAD(P)-dependent oxidoreductase [bacterium]MCP5071029.1 SDR family NAD(P)-dependent oxidoreductase [bacterium]
MSTTSLRVAILTGAASGIGRAMAQALATDGYSLELMDVNGEALDDLVKTFRKQGSPAQANTCDVGDREQVERAFEQMTARHSRIDLLVNNAGITAYDTVSSTTLDDYDRIMRVNFGGTLHCTKALLPTLLRQGHGHVANISSVFGLIGAPLQSAYSASKFAIRGFSESLRQELLGTGIGVSCVHPGGVRTGIVAGGRVGENRLETAGAATFNTDFERFSRLTSEQAARQIVAGIRKRKARILVGVDAHAISGASRLFPVFYQRLNHWLGLER